MPAHQVLPNEYDQSGQIWGTAIANISSILGQGITEYATEYEKSKKLTGHNDRVYADAVDSLKDIQSRNNLSKDQYASLLRQITPEKDDPDYEKKIGNVFGSLLFWDQSGAGKAGVPLPDFHIDPDTNSKLIISQLSKMKETQNIQDILGNPSAPAAGSGLNLSNASGQPSGGTQAPGSQTLSQMATGNWETMPASELAKDESLLSNNLPVASQPANISQNPTLANASLSPSFQQKVDSLTDPENKKTLMFLAGQLGKTIDSHEFTDEYVKMMKDETKVAKELANKEKLERDKLKADLLKEREVIGEGGKSRPTSMADYDNPNVQFGGKLPTKSVSTSYSFSSSGKPEEDPYRTPKHYQEVQKEVNSRANLAVKNGENPVAGAAELEKMILDFKIPTNLDANNQPIAGGNPRSYAEQALPVYYQIQGIPGIEGIEKDKILSYVVMCKVKGYSDRKIYDTFRVNMGK